MSPLAVGPFEVKMLPVESLPEAPGSALARMTLDKQFHGELEAVGQGQVLTAISSEVKGSAGYVAIERVTGVLHGRAGSFVLQHSSRMERGVPTQSVTIVPDTGTGGLVGISGSMRIRIEERQHFYDLEYELCAN